LEDLGSTNGTFLNGERIQRAVAKPGDEIGFDTLRFRLFEMGKEDDKYDSVATAQTAGVPRWVWWAAAALVLALVVIWAI
jgi:pSer/pThr/pTyr-binding forkhead associated (FHA) protein